MGRQKYQTVQEYTHNIAGLSFQIKSRIKHATFDTKNPSIAYLWELSHYCKPFKDAAGVYIPSNQFGSSFEEAESQMLKYIDRFTTFDVTADSAY